MSRSPSISTAEAPTLDDVLRVFSRPITGSPKTEEAKPKKVQDGGLCRTKTLYEGSSSCPGCIKWVEQIPEPLKESVEESSDAKQHAIIARMRKSHGPSEKPLEVDSIIIQSPLLRPVLEDVFKDYPGVTPTLQDLKFSAPFWEFFHRHEQLEKSMEKQEGETRAHTRLLLDTLKPTLSDIQRVSDDLIQNGVMTYDYLWTLFPPGALVYHLLSGQNCLFEVERTKYDMLSKKFVIRCRCIDWDGKMFGWKEFVFDIRPFSGTKAIHDLEVYPLTYHRSAEDIESSLSARGRKFVSLQGSSHYKAYEGVLESVGEYSSQYVKSHIVVDTKTFSQYTTLSEILKPLEKEDEDDDEDVMNFSEHHFLLCSAKVKGYSLETKTWGHFAVDNISDIQWDEDSFTDLVLPDDTKRLLLSLVRTQIHRDKGPTFDDVIERRGKGSVFLLTGDSGVGKTLTAESISEKMRIPLYTLSAGELGASPKDIENNLAKALDLSYRWKAMLLLDESNLFLEKRNADHLKRNQIVSTFLRMLENQRGIIFLTSNRLVLDTAFRSRIHFTLQYPDLDLLSRLKIWKLHLQRAGWPTDLSDEQIDVLAQQQLNGREIKNAVRSAQLLAADDEVALNLGHIETVLRVTQVHRMVNVPEIQEKQDHRTLDVVTKAQEVQDQRKVDGPKTQEIHVPKAREAQQDYRKSNISKARETHDQRKMDIPKTQDSQDYENLIVSRAQEAHERKKPDIVKAQDMQDQTDVSMEQKMPERKKHEAQETTDQIGSGKSPAQGDVPKAQETPPETQNDPPRAQESRDRNKSEVAAAQGQTQRTPQTPPHLQTPKRNFTTSQERLSKPSKIKKILSRVRAHSK